MQPFLCHYRFISNSVIKFPIFSIVLLLISLCINLSVYAASDGSLGATSTGTTDLSLSVSDMVKVSGMANLSFGSYGGSGTTSQNDDICIYSNNSSGLYKVTATGSGAASAFTVSDGSSHTIAYTVKFNDQTGTAGSVALTSNVLSGTQSGANTSSQSCGGSNNANLEVAFTQSALMSAPAAAYSGVLTIVIQPN